MKAKEALLSHFERNKYDKASDLLLITSLGDRTPSDLLRYMRSLQPGEAETSLFIVIFLNALPRNARDAALPHAPTLDDMAKAADVVLAIPEPKVVAVQAVQQEEDFVVDETSGHVDAISRRTARPAQGSSLCNLHRKFKDKAYKCADPDRCPMREVLHPRPQAGNAKAGRQ